MDNKIYTPTALFDREETYDKTAPIIECIGPHTHKNKSGFLFKELRSKHLLFIAKDEILSGETQPGFLYLFRGFVTDSAVVSISPYE